MTWLFSLLSSFFLGTTPSAVEPPKVRPATLETATLAAGCFWGSEEFFRKVPGVYETRVGYIGGPKKSSYEEVTTGKTGHAEAVEVSFDPTKVTYEELLTLFFKFHDPTTKDRQGNDWGSQYRSAIFVQNETQANAAKALMVKIERSGAWKKPLSTQIAKAKPFYAAEDYHQKYLVKNPGGYDNHYLRNLDFDHQK
ncbi:MAG: peptide-methionine (S)-S-oxide reductase [Proteobacteria bacterium]|nr:MAG: peptide-methionine (S)-S-oxide reductase [Pseudomonadota bacterium]